MPQWKPVELFKGEDVYIIGGGPSLADFDWSLLLEKNTIGCNSAFKLGADVCDICFFSDAEWFYKFKEELAAYEGMVITHSPKLYNDSNERLLTMTRSRLGLHKEALSFNGSSGASAINLALICGARRVFLLGFDCSSNTSTGPNWHKDTPQPPARGLYDKFLEGFHSVATNLHSVFPRTEVINLANDPTPLNAFPTDTITNHFQ